MLPETEVLTDIVERVSPYRRHYPGRPQERLLVRYRGKCSSEDTAAAYDQLAEALRPMEITPLFRLEEKQHAVILMKGIIKPKASKDLGEHRAVRPDVRSACSSRRASYTYTEPT